MFRQNPTVLNRMLLLALFAALGINSVLNQGNKDKWQSKILELSSTTTVERHCEAGDNGVIVCKMRGDGMKEDVNVTISKAHFATPIKNGKKDPIAETFGAGNDHNCDIKPGTDRSDPALCEEADGVTIALGDPTCTASDGSCIGATWNLIAGGENFKSQAELFAFIGNQVKAKLNELAKAKKDKDKELAQAEKDWKSCKKDKEGEPIKGADEKLACRIAHLESDDFKNDMQKQLYFRTNIMPILGRYMRDGNFAMALSMIEELQGTGVDAIDAQLQGMQYYATEKPELILRAQKMANSMNRLQAAYEEYQRNPMNYEARAAVVEEQYNLEAAKQEMKTFGATATENYVSSRMGWEGDRAATGAFDSWHMTLVNDFKQAGRNPVSYARANRIDASMLGEMYANGDSYGLDGLDGLFGIDGLDGLGNLDDISLNNLSSRSSRGSRSITTRPGASRPLADRRELYDRDRYFGDRRDTSSRDRYSRDYSRDSRDRSPLFRDRNDYRDRRYASSRSRYA